MLLPQNYFTIPDFLLYPTLLYPEDTVYGTHCFDKEIKTNQKKLNKEEIVVLPFKQH